MKNEQSQSKWYVADCHGNLAGHDMSKLAAQYCADTMQDREPDNDWEAMCGDDDEE